MSKNFLRTEKKHVVVSRGSCPLNWTCLAGHLFVSGLQFFTLKRHSECSQTPRLQDVFTSVKKYPTSCVIKPNTHDSLFSIMKVRIPTNTHHHLIYAPGWEASPTKVHSWGTNWKYIGEATWGNISCTKQKFVSKICQKDREIIWSEDVIMSLRSSNSSCYGCLHILNAFSNSTS